jgi:predicted nucleic acid-binding Zn ribbon protein
MRDQNDQSLKEVLQQMMELYRWKGKLHQSRIRSLWEKKMGTTINQYTREIKVVRKKLYLTIDSAPLKQELSMSKEKIRAMVNEAIGEDYVEDVIIR